MGNFLDIARREIVALHRDEEGLSTVEGMLLLGVAVLIMIGLLQWFAPEVTNKVKQNVSTLLGPFTF